MNDLITVILSSTLITTVLSFFFNTVANRRSASIENITKERKNWRDEMREIAKDIQSSKDTRQLSIALSALKVRINAYGIARDSIFCDSHIWKRLYFFEQEKTHTSEELEEAKRMFVNMISCLLKYDWERAKAEIKGNAQTRILGMTLIFSFALHSIKYLYPYTNGTDSFLNYLDYVVSYGVFVFFAMLLIYAADKWKDKFTFTLYVIFLATFVASGLFQIVVNGSLGSLPNFIVNIAPLAALLYGAEVKLLLYRQNVARYILSLAWVCGVNEIPWKYSVFFYEKTYGHLFNDDVITITHKQSDQKKISAKK